MTGPGQSRSKQNEAAWRARDGQVSVELVAVLPALAACALLLAQLGGVGWAQWSAANAARAGARAAIVGGSAERAARSALPGLMRDGAEVSEDGGVRVKVAVPSVVPGLRLGSVSAVASLKGDAPVTAAAGGESAGG